MRIEIFKGQRRQRSEGGREKWVVCMMGMGGCSSSYGSAKIPVKLQACPLQSLTLNSFACWTFESSQIMATPTLSG